MKSGKAKAAGRKEGKTTAKGQSRLAHIAQLMDRVMSGARARVAAPKAAPKELSEHRLTKAQIDDVAAKVSLRHIRGKGLGLVARRALAPHTRIGVYGGKVYTAGDHQRLTGAGVSTGKYAIDYFKKTRDGKVRGGYIMDPGAGNSMHPTHSNVLAAFINEPAMGQTPNVVWVRNYKTGTMELWTTTAVPKGEELTACYGGAYPRGYKTPCTRRPGYLHYVSASNPLPVLV